jgi:hypothetical protein
VSGQGAGPGPYPVTSCCGRPGGLDARYSPWPVDLAGLTGGDVELTILVPRPGAFVFHKSLVFRNRRDRLKAEKDLYYVFFVLDAFPEWREAIDAELGRLAAQKPAWFKKCLKNLNAIFDGPESRSLSGNRSRNRLVWRTRPSERSLSSEESASKVLWPRSEPLSAVHGRIQRAVAFVRRGLGRLRL